jgi:hypothetical protein
MHFLGLYICDKRFKIPYRLAIDSPKKNMLNTIEIAFDSLNTDGIKICGETKLKENMGFTKSSPTAHRGKHAGPHSFG